MSREGSKRLAELTFVVCWNACWRTIQQMARWARGAMRERVEQYGASTRDGDGGGYDEGRYPNKDRSNHGGIAPGAGCAIDNRGGIGSARGFNNDAHVTMPAEVVNTTGDGCM